MAKKIGRIAGLCLTVILAAVLLCNVYTIGVRLITGNPQPTVLGWSCAIVISGSMEPEIQVDDMIIVHKQKNYQVGNVITFKSGKSLVTHRIVEEQADSYTTKGDANNTRDTEPVSKENVIGKVVCTVPGMGKLVSFLQTPWGIICLVLAGYLMIELSFVKRKE